MTRCVAVVVVALGVLSVPASAQGPRQDGRWEVKMEMSMPGMPAAMPPIMTTQCITPEDAKDPQKAVATGQGGEQGNCKVTNYKVAGNKVTWSMACDGREAMTGTGEFLYAGDTSTGTIKMNRAGQVMTMKYTGKRLGDCTK
jgi:hypothetical protein